MNSFRSRNEPADSEADPSQASCFTKIVYVIFVLNVLGVLVLILGMIAGWFSINGERMADDTYRLGLVFDSQEAGDDIGETVNAASNMSETAKSASELNTYDGVVKALQPGQDALLLHSEKADYEVHFTDATEFGDEALTSIHDLKVGERLRLTVKDRDGRLFAIKVKKEEPEEN